jgi:hypothetical protein
MVNHDFSKIVYLCLKMSKNLHRKVLTEPPIKYKVYLILLPSLLSKMGLRLANGNVRAGFFFGR